MTAPVAVTPQAPQVTPPAAPVVETPQTPHVPSKQELATTVRQESGNVVSKFLAKTLTRPIAAEVVAEVTGETPPADPAAPTTPATETVAPAVESAPAAEATPSQLVAEITADEPDSELSLRARDPSTGQFSEMDQTRMYELSIKDKATGERKVYEKSLPDLMRMARDGVAARQHLDELNHYRNEFGQWQGTHQRLTQRAESAEQTAQRLEAFAISLLTDPPELVDRQRAQYQSEFTPEKQVARLQAEIAQLRNGRQNGNAPAYPPAAPVNNGADPNTQAAIQTLGQRVNTVIMEAEKIVGLDAAMGKAMRELGPLYVNGRIPVERFAQVEQYLTGPYAKWVQDQAGQKQSEKQSAAQAAKEVEAARLKVQQDQARAQKAAQLVGTATRPSPVSQGAAPSGPQITPRSTVQDRIAAIVRRPTSAG